ncbi:MAG: hypothetical protein V4448_17760 [Pseudomonadota bacterium]
MSQARQESVTIETLDLLQKTVDYLKRLPKVPITHDLIREIDSHLANPGVSAARREAETQELLASMRVAQQFSPAGLVLFEVVVEASQVTVKVPALPSGVVERMGDRRVDRLRDGITMVLKPTSQKK